jgi:hypothetical protein
MIKENNVKSKITRFFMIAKPIIVALNSTTYTPIEIPKDYPSNDVARVITYWVEGLPEWLQAWSDAGEAEIPIPAETIFTEAYVMPTNRVLFYAKAVSGTPNLIVKLGETR